MIKREVSGILHKNYSLLMLFEKQKENNSEIILASKKKGNPDFLQEKKFIQEYLDKQVKENFNSVNHLKAKVKKNKSKPMGQGSNIIGNLEHSPSKISSETPLFSSIEGSINDMDTSTPTAKAINKDGRVSASICSSIGSLELPSDKTSSDINSDKSSEQIENGKGVGSHKWRSPLVGCKQVTKGDNSQNETNVVNPLQNSGDSSGSKVPTPLVIDMKSLKVNAKENINSKDEDECVIILDEEVQPTEVQLHSTKRKRDRSAHRNVSQKHEVNLTNDTVIVIDDTPEDIQCTKRPRNSLNDSVIIVEDTPTMIREKRRKKSSVLGLRRGKGKKTAEIQPVSNKSEGKELKDYVSLLNKDFIPLGDCASVVTYVKQPAPFCRRPKRFQVDAIQEPLFPVYNDKGKNSCSGAAFQPSTSQSIALQQQQQPPAVVGDNISSMKKSNDKQKGLRPIVIDGSNVAMGHTNGRIFSCEGLKICIDYFLERKHKVIAFVPRYRQGRCTNTDLLSVLEKRGLVTFTPSRRVNGKLIVSYDDRFIVQYAAECGGVIVSTDNYRDLLNENPQWKETIEQRLLMFTWAGDLLMFPHDPMGRGGPTLEELLRFPD